MTIACSSPWPRPSCCSHWSVCSRSGSFSRAFEATGPRVLGLLILVVLVFGGAFVALVAALTSGLLQRLLLGLGVVGTTVAISYAVWFAGAPG